MDFLDIFDVSVGAGPVVRADVRYGFGNLGLGWANTYRVRFGGRSALTKEEAGEIALLPPPLSQIAFLFYCYAEGEAWGLAVLSGFSDEVERTAIPSDCSAGTGEIHRLWIGLLNQQIVYGSSLGGVERTPPVAIGAELHALLGFRARVYLVEIVDFVTGIFGFDVLADNENLQ